MKLSDTLLSNLLTEWLECRVVFLQALVGEQDFPDSDCFVECYVIMHQILFTLRTYLCKIMYT